MLSPPLAYFITFNCYGQWLHGDQRGSVDREHNDFGAPLLPPDKLRERAALQRMQHPAYQLDALQRRVVLAAIREVCEHRDWRLWAVHVRSRHVHVVVTGGPTPEQAMNALKAYASRALNRFEPDLADRKRWARHGSTRYINDQLYLERACHYVLFKQGDPQECFDGRRDGIGGKCRGGQDTP